MRLRSVGSWIELLGNTSADDVVDCHFVYCSVGGCRIELCDLDCGDLQPLSEDTVDRYSASSLSMHPGSKTRCPF